MPVMTHETGAAWASVTIEAGEQGLTVVRPTGAEDVPNHVGSAIDVSGATLVVDVRAGNGPPVAYIFDAYWALTWLEQVYGPAVVDQVKAVSADPTSGPVVVNATYDELSDVVVRLGVATWLHRWWPSGNPALGVTFSVQLLEVEIGALRWLAEAAFIETSPIERALAPHGEVLSSSYHWNHYENRGFGQEVVDEMLTTALRAFVDTVDETAMGYAECADLLNAIDEGAHWSRDDMRLFAELLGSQESALQLTRGGKGGHDDAQARGSSNVTSGWSTADPRDLPPRTLTDVDANVEWRVETVGDETRIVVTALAAPAVDASSDVGLMARAFVDDIPLVIDLAWEQRTNGSVFTGTAPLPAATESVEVSVFHPLWAGSARIRGAALSRAEAERSEVTEVLVDRYTSLGARLAAQEVRADPAGRPTAAEIVAKFRDR